MYRKSLIYILIVAFTATSIILPQKSYAAPLLGLPEPGKMVSLSTPFAPAMIKGLTVSKTNPFQFDFIVDVGQDRLQGEALKAEGDKLIKYFLASLAIPEKDWWVNLSPYEKDKTAPEALSQTDMGRDLLAQDYILKQITASLIYPEKELGKTFWDRVYAKSQELYGNTQIPVNTFNKVWITADQAEVFEHHQTAFVTKAHLKVMLEEDYLASQKHNVETRFIASQTTNKTTQNIIREIIIPELEKEVNEGKNFANLRQIFNALILASWYKNNLKTALLTQVYADKSTVKGIDLDDKTIKEQIYNRYLQAYKKGVFNFVKEDTQNNQITPRKYFSGGVNPGMAANPRKTTDMVKLGFLKDSTLVNFSTGFSNQAMSAEPEFTVGGLASGDNDIGEMFRQIRYQQSNEISAFWVKVWRAVSQSTIEQPRKEELMQDLILARAQEGDPKNLGKVLRQAVEVTGDIDSLSLMIERLIKSKTNQPQPSSLSILDDFTRRIPYQKFELGDLDVAALKSNEKYVEIIKRLIGRDNVTLNLAGFDFRSFDAWDEQKFVDLFNKALYFTPPVLSEKNIKGFLGTYATPTRLKQLWSWLIEQDIIIAQSNGYVFDPRVNDFGIIKYETDRIKGVKMAEPLFDESLPLQVRLEILFGNNDEGRGAAATFMSNLRTSSFWYFYLFSFESVSRKYDDLYDEIWKEGRIINQILYNKILLLSTFPEAIVKEREILKLSSSTNIERSEVEVTLSHYKRKNATDVQIKVDPDHWVRVTLPFSQEAINTMDATTLFSIVYTYFNAYVANNSNQSSSIDNEDAAMISKQLTDENKSVSFELADKRSEFKLLLGKLTSRIEFEWGHYRINGGEWVKYSEDNPRLFPRKNVAFKLENRDGKYVVIFDYVNPFTDEYDPVEITRVAGFVVLRMSSNDRAMANKTNPISGPLKTFEEIVAELRVQAEPFLNDEYVKNNYKFWDAKAYADLKGRVIKTVERRNSNISVKWVYKNDLYRPSLESVYADYDGLPEQKERFQDLAVKETYFKQILINGKFILSADEKDKERTNYMLYLAVELGLISVPTDDAMTTPQTNYVETTDEIKEVLKNWQTAVRVFNTNNYLDRHKDVPDGDIVLFYAGDKNNPQGILLATWISDKQRWNIDIVEANKGDRSNVGRLLVEGFVNEYGQDLIGIQPIRMDGGKVEVWIRVLRSLGFRGSGFDFMHYPDKAMNAASSRGVEQREFSRSNLQGLRTSVNRLDDRVFRLSLEIEYLEKLRNSYRRAFLLLTQVEDPKDRSYEFEKLVEGPAVVLEAGGEYHLARKGPLHMGDETKKLMKAVSRRAKRENAYTNEAWQKAINEVSASLNADLQHAIDGKKVVKESIGGRLEVERGLLDKINGARRSINNKDNVREIKYMEEFLSNLNVMFQRLAPMYKDKKDAKVFYLTDIFTLSSFRIKNINTKIFGNYLVNLANEMSKNEAMHEIMLAFKDFLATQQTTLSIDKGLLLNIEEAKELKSLFVGFILQRLTSAVEGYEKILASFNNGHRQYVLESIDYDIDLLKRNVTILLEDKYIEEGQRNQLKTLLSRLDALTWNAPTLRGMDLAMNTTDQYGGIDLKATADNTLVKKDLENGVQMDIDPAMIERFKRDGIESLTPVIFNITPIANIWQTIGLTPP